MTTATQETETTKQTATLEYKWTVSRGRDTYGYNICTLYVDGERVARCNGGGYDMQGTCLGSFIASRFADRLNAMRPEDMPKQSHWQASKKPRRICSNHDCPKYGKAVFRRGQIENYPKSDDDANCPHCHEWTRPDAHDGERIDDGHYFYGLTFHDPNYDPGKAIVGEDCHDRTLSKESSEGKTVEQCENDGVSFGLERLQAAYKASSKTPTDRHTLPTIDGACGMSSVESIARAIGVEFEYVPTKSRKQTIYRMIY